MWRGSHTHARHWDNALCVQTPNYPLQYATTSASNLSYGDTFAHLHVSGKAPILRHTSNILDGGCCIYTQHTSGVRFTERF